MQWYPPSPITDKLSQVKEEKAHINEDTPIIQFIESISNISRGNKAG